MEWWGTLLTVWGGINMFSLYITYFFFVFKFVIKNNDTELLWYKILVLLMFWPLLLVYVYQVLAINKPKVYQVEILNKPKPDQTTKETQNENGE